MQASVLIRRLVELKNKIDGPCACTAVPIKYKSFFKVRYMYCTTVKEREKIPLR